MKFLSLSSIILLPVFFGACAVPSSSLTTVSVNGTLIDEYGVPISNKHVEMVLPAEYGLNEIDLDQGDAKSYGHKDQYAKTSTDSLGTFSHTFAPVEYSTRFWILPPLGTIFSTPPEPKFFIRLPKTDATYYSVLVNPKETLYGVYQIASGARTVEGAVSVATAKPAEVKGRLIEDKRGEGEAWIADLKFQYLPKTERSAKPREMRSMFETSPKRLQ